MRRSPSYILGETLSSAIGFGVDQGSMGSGRGARAGRKGVLCGDRPGVPAQQGRLSVGEEAGEALSEAADALSTHFVLTKAAPWHRHLCKGEGIGQRLGFAKGQ